VKKALMAIPYFLLWLLYVIITVDARQRYMAGKSMGYHCYQKKDTSRFIYGSVTEYSFNRGIPPQRGYLTWREFWEDRRYYKTKNINE
jgi:hypothetical protein